MGVSNFVPNFRKAKVIGRRFGLCPKIQPMAGGPNVEKLISSKTRAIIRLLSRVRFIIPPPDGTHLQSTDIYTFSPGNGADKFHTYMLEWTTNSISWFVDNQLYETQTNWSTANAPYPAPFNQPFYIIMNLAIGGVYDGNPDTNTVFPGEMQVDYVRVYSNTE